MKYASLPVCLSMLVALCAVAKADDSDDNGLPTVELLPCAVKCANSTRAVPIKTLFPHFPQSDYNDYVEGFVQPRYTVGTDGLVNDVVVENIIGPDEFARNAERALKERTFEPATLDGKPVEQTLVLNTVFSAAGLSAGGSKSFVADYGDAVALIKDRKYDEAIAKLEEMNAQARLNFYERGMLAHLLAPLAMVKKDYLSVRDLVYVPSEFFFKELPQSVEFDLLRDRMQADLALGNVGDALLAVNVLKLRVKQYDVDDPVLKLVEDARIKMSALPQIATTEKIPASGTGDGALLLMSHRDFTFQNVSGSLDKFEIQCRQATIASKISESAEWHVPKDWNQCFLFVHGAPGTTFDVVQFTSPPAEKPPAQ